MTWICKGLDYLQKQHRSYVIREGDDGDRFYIVLKGRCSVWVPLKIEEMVKPI